MFEEDGDSSESLQKSLAPTTQGVLKFGQFRALMQIADNFDVPLPLPDAFWLGES